MDKAVFELSDKLRHPSDMGTKLDSIEAQTKEAYEMHESKYKSELILGYSRIRNISKKIEEINTTTEQFNIKKSNNVVLLKGFTDLIKDYRTVREVCKAHQHFAKIKKFIDQLKSIDETCENDDLEVYHRAIYEKEEFMCELDVYNYELDKEDFARIEHAINRIKKDSLEFTTLLLQIVGDFIANSEALEKVNTIIEIEEKRDSLTAKAREGEKKKDIELEHIAEMYPRYITRSCKNLKTKVIGAIKSSIESKFNQINTDAAFINQLDFVLDDLDKIHKNVKLACFTFDDFLKAYYVNLKKVLDENICNFDAGEILALIEFKTNFYNVIESKYNKVGESLGPRLIESEAKLLEKYSAVASQKLKEWIENITTSEIDKYSNRDSELVVDENKKLVSPGFISLLQIIKSQMEPISFNKHVFLYITETVRLHCETFKERIVDAIKNDYTLACAGKAKPGFEDYCIMFGNSGLKLTQYITSLPQCQSPEVRELGNIFLQILKNCNFYLAEFVMHTCSPVVSLLFKDDWYEQKIQKTFVVTIEDFMQDYQGLMASYSFTTFIFELGQSIIGCYFMRMAAKNITISKNTGQILRFDCSQLKKCLQPYAQEKELDGILTPINIAVKLLETSSDEVFMTELKALKMSYSELKQKTIENVVQKSCLLSDSSKKKILMGLKDVFEQKSLKKKVLFAKLL
ncbi:exocyst complex component 3 [Enteropsectra breve]|nr:exocyst complex component 3 [Enteropsectra breve]